MISSSATSISSTEKPAVLVVEDEALIRMFAAEIAADAGFRCIEAARADEALRKLEQDDGIGIVFTDIHMAGSMDGLQMAHLVRDRWPPVRFLIVSGHTRLAPDQIPAESRFFSKPYDADDIVESLNALARDWTNLSAH